MQRAIAMMNKVTQWLEMVVAGVLVFMIALGVGALVIEIVRGTMADAPFPGVGVLLRAVDLVLIVFILVELFNIALAYMQHRNVLPTVLEAALVAVARKLVVFEIGEAPLPEAAGLALMLIAIAATWFLLRRANVCGSDATATTCALPSERP